jgi:hypothetical protein
MKINSSLRLLKLSRLAPLAIVIGTTLVAQLARGDSNSLVLTELSDTSLTATYSGTGTVSVAPGPHSDEWLVTFTGATFSGGAEWIEPENSTLFNSVVRYTTSNVLAISSEDPLRTAIRVSDGTTVPNFGTDTGNGGSISVTFYDKGDAPVGVPDSGSTFGLLSVALLSIFGAARFRSRQLA